MKFIPLLFTFFLLFCISCSDKNVNNNLGATILDTMSYEKLQESSNRTLTEEEGKKSVTFTVIYSGDIDAMANNNESDFKAILEAYGLEMDKSFEIDEDNKGIVLVASSNLNMPIEIGKEISMINEVLMVEVGNVNNTEDTVS